MGRDIVLRDRTEPLVRSMRSMLQANQEDYLVAALRHLQSMVSCSIVMYDINLHMFASRSQHQ